MMDQGWESWLKEKPECVRKLAAEFPLGTIILLDNETLYLIGYTEEDRLIVSAINPTVDYDAAARSKKYICADHARTKNVR